MAMIKCPECHHHISSMAKACPECGCPIEETEKTESVEGTVEQPETKEPAPSEEGRHFNILVAVVVIIGLLIGGLYFYDYRAEKQRELRAYELLKECSNPDFYEDFIIRFPKSEYIEEVRERYSQVASQQDEWQRLISTGSRDDLKRFVNQHPTSPYVKVAQGRIDSLDWGEAKEARTLEAVTRYMADHPNGYYIDQAEVLRQTLERARAEAAALAAAQRDSTAVADSTQTGPN